MFASVLVELKIKKIDQTFTYIIPDKLKNQVEIGKRVMVPFGGQKLEGFVIDINNNKSDFKLKDHNIPSEFMGEINDELSDLENTQDEVFEDELKSTNFNIFFGGEYTFYKELSLDVRYTVGLTNYIKKPVDNEELKMNYLQIGLGYKF